MSEAVKKIDKGAAIKWAVTILLALCICLVPTNAIFTSVIRMFLATTVFFILIVAFELMDFMFVSIALPFSYVFLGIAPLTTVMSGWSGTVPWMVIGAFLLANVLNDVGLLKRIAFWCILKTGGSYNGILYGILFAGIILTVLTSGNAYYLMAPFCYGICLALDTGKSRESAVIMGVGAVSTVASMMFIYQPASVGLLLAGNQAVNPNFSITWTGIIMQNAPQILFCVFFVFLLTKLFKPGRAINGNAYFKKEYQALGTVTTKEKKAAVATTIIFTYLLTSGLHGFPIYWGFIALPWMMCLPGFNLVTKENITGINYTMAFFTAACISIGMVSTELGLGKILSDMLVPILSTFSSSTVLVVIWIFGVFANFILTPSAILASFSAPIAQIAIDLGINQLAAAYALYYSTDQILLAYESVPYLIFFTFGLMSVKDFAKIMGLKMLLQLIFLLLIFIPYWHLIGVF